MKKIMILSIFLFSVSCLISQTESSKHSFVGVQVCAPCHKTEKQGMQLDKWEKSKHSGAFKTLQTEEANAIAKEKGCETPAAETEACLKCHASGYNFEPAMLGEKFKMEDGVQCETCHGPGSDYKALKIMKSREESIANGLMVYENREDLCVKCHNPESPTYKEMDFNEAWQKIAHPVPAK